MNRHKTIPGRTASLLTVAFLCLATVTLAQTKTGQSKPENSGDSQPSVQTPSAAARR